MNVWNLLSHGFFRTDSRTLFAPVHNVVVYDHTVEYPHLSGMKLIFLTGVTISDGTYEAVRRCVEEGAACVLPPRLAPPDSGFAQIREITEVSQGKRKWLIVSDFYKLHYEAFEGGPAHRGLRDTFKPLIGNGSHLEYNFGDTVARMAQQGWDYLYQKFGGSEVPVTQAGTNPDVLEVEVVCDK